MNIIMDAKEIEQIKSAIQEVFRLAALSAVLQDQLEKACREPGIVVAQEYAVTADLFKLLKANGTAAHFLRSADKGVSNMLFKLLLVHFGLNKLVASPDSIAGLKTIVQQDAQLKANFNHRHNFGLLIVYLEKAQKVSWITYANNAAGEHSEITALNESLPFCKGDLNTLLTLISKIKNKYPDRASYRLLAGSILYNLKTDQSFRSVILSSVNQFFEKPEWKEMFPYFLKGAINDDPELFKQHYEQIVNDFAHHPLAERLYPLAIACPDDEPSLVFFFHS
ncbi:MAG TPA: hypothetical protein VGM63_10395, partial [Mucilaginibacter sp.]